MLYAVTEIAAFMVGATIIGFLLGRVSKRGAPKSKAGGDSAELAAAQTAVRDLESERADLKGQLLDAKERVRQLAAEPTASETSEATEELRDQKRSLQKALEEARAQADRLRATIAERDLRIAEMGSGEAPAAPSTPSAPVGYSSSAGTLADMRIVFEEEDRDS